MKTGLLLRQTDREDGWVSGIVFVLEKIRIHYEDSFNEIKEHLTTKEVVDYLTDELCLIDDLFDGDETYKITSVRWEYGVIFVFQNDENEERELKLFVDDIGVFDGLLAKEDEQINEAVL
jgi:hypothetical protein